jgi:hypothetical protein
MGVRGWGGHSDDEPTLGIDPIIASLSLGAARKFCFRHKKTKQTVAVMLELGSKMKCNTLECGLEKRAQKGVADETVSTIKLGRKREDGSAKAIGVLYSGDCLSIRANREAQFIVN